MKHETSLPTVSATTNHNRIIFASNWLIRKFHNYKSSIFWIFLSLEMKNIFYLLVIFGTFGRKNFRKKTFHNRVLNPDRESLKLSMSSVEVRTKNPGTCQKPRIAMANGASLQCPDRIGDRDRCRYRCPKGFILKPGSNNVIGSVLYSISKSFPSKLN